MSQKSGIRVQCSQQEVDDFLLNDDNFEKLYNRLGENDDLRKLFDMAFDFRRKKEKNHCIAMNIGEYMLCGEPCEDVFCHKHMLQIKVLRMIPRPCRVCGIGVINTYCSTCIVETRTREQSLRLAKEFEDLSANKLQVLGCG